MNSSNIRDKDLIVCALAQNAASSLKRNLPKLEKLRPYVDNLHIIIAENDSQDSSPNILKTWAEQNKSNHLLNPQGLTENLPPLSGNPYYSMRRVEKMARLRNQVLDFIETENLEGDFLMWLDIDVKDFSIASILRNLSRHEEWDVILANGVISNQYNSHYLYYDTFATQLQEGPTKLTQNILEERQMILAKTFREPIWHPVRSAFGGIGIYKRALIHDLRYSAQSNADPDVQAQCEHVPFHQAIIERGYPRIYVDSQMKVYHDLRLKNLLKLPERWLRTYLIKPLKKRLRS